MAAVEVVLREEVVEVAPDLLGLQTGGGQSGGPDALVR